jgi:NAD+---dinitrogen-reductase ADP-D-ribosyltransferase
MLELEELYDAERHDPRHWYSTNLVGVSSQLIASVDFNDFPQRLTISSTRFTHNGLFALLREARDQAEAADTFTHYMKVAFGLDKAAEGDLRTHKSSYVKLLQGWGFDANGQPGAVLKGWVESRFGVSPTYHKQPLDHFPSEAWMRYLEEKLSSRFHNNCIQLQLDVLYEYCQWSLGRFEPFGGPRVRLYRGIDRAEAKLLSGSLAERRGVLRLNNLVSFSTARERAEEFGSVMLTVHVPVAKFLFYPGLLADRVLNGEGEILVIGGDYEVSLSYA